MRFGLYVRCSTKGDAQDPLTQLIPLRDWAERQGIETREYVDRATGRHQVRPDFQRLLHDLRHGELDGVACTRLSRVGRSVRDLHAFVDELESRKLRFVCINQPVDTSTAAGRLMLTILGALAEFEVELIRDGVMEGLDRARRQGKRLGRPRKVGDRRLLRTVREAGGIRPAAKSLGVSMSTVSARVRKTPDGFELVRS